MHTSRTVLGTLVALTSVALTTVAGTARADHLGAGSGDSVGSGDFEASYYASAGLTHCNAAELAAAGTPTTGCLIKLGNICIVKAVLYPECLNASATQSYAKAAATASGSVTVFGDYESIDATPSATTKDGHSSLTFIVQAFGNTVLNTSQTNIPLGVGASFGGSKHFSVAGVSLKVKAEASAWIGATIGGGVIANGVSFDVDPTITAGVDASADVGAACASAGISGELDALDLELPSTLSVAYANDQLTFGVDTDFTYSALSGSLKVHANLCGVAGGSTTIASYGGWSGAFSVYQGSGTLSL